MISEKTIYLVQTAGQKKKGKENIKKKTMRGKIADGDGGDGGGSAAVAVRLKVDSLQT